MLITLLLCLSIWLVFYIVNKLEEWDQKIRSTFECGFSPLFRSRFRYSIPYFLLTIIFLFLDLELCVIIPNFIINSIEVKNLTIRTIIIIIIILRLAIEWKTEELNWIK